MNAVVVASFIETAGDDARQRRVPVQAKDRARMARVEQRHTRGIIRTLRQVVRLGVRELRMLPWKSLEATSA